MNTELEHSGVKGMKWGVRRYQNPDGTLTAEGKKRYKSIGLGTRGQVKKLYKAETQEGRDKAASKLAKRKDKVAKKITKLEAKNEKLERNREKQVLTSDVKAAQYQRQADIYTLRAGRRFQTSRGATKNARRAMEYQAEANEYESRALATKAKIAQNAKMRELLNTEMSNIDAFLVDAGHKYVKSLKG